MLIYVNKSEKKNLIYVTVMVISLLTMAIFPKMSKLPYLLVRVLNKMFSLILKFSRNLKCANKIILIKAINFLAC